MKKLLLILLVACCTFCFTACNNGNGDTSESSSQSRETSSNQSSETSSTQSSAQVEMHYGTGDGTTAVDVFLVGDSTVCEYASTADYACYIPRTGYGMKLGQFFNTNVTIKNLAISGRSSLSFLPEANYTTLKNEIGAGDYLIIGFGHNDEKTDAARFTDPTKGTNEVGSFKYTLNENYIKLAIEKGATPILCTPIVRLSNNGYTGAKIHIANGGDYSQNIRDLGAETGVTVIDLTTLTKALYESLGYDEASKLHATSSQTVGAIPPIDQTHINAYGAQVISKFIAQELVKTQNTLKNYVLATLPEPSMSEIVYHSYMLETSASTSTAA